MPLAGLEPTFLASHGSQTHTLDRAATGIGKFTLFFLITIATCITIKALFHTFLNHFKLQHRNYQFYILYIFYYDKSFQHY